MALLLNRREKMTHNHCTELCARVPPLLGLEFAGPSVAVDVFDEESFLLWWSDRLAAERDKNGMRLGRHIPEVTGGITPSNGTW